MPGQDKQTTDQSQKSVSSPWDPAKPMLMDLLNKYGGMKTDVTGGQKSALDNLTGAASGIPNFGDSSSDAIRKLFSSNTDPQVGMLNDAFSSFRTNLTPTASGANLDPYATPGFSDAIERMTGDITNKTKATYAAAGRDPSGAGSFAGSLGRGLTEGIAPVIANQYNINKQGMDAANNALLTGASNTASGITGQKQTMLQNLASAIGLIPSASTSYTAPGATQLGAANQAYSQPWTNLAQLLGPITGIAGLGGQTDSTGRSTTAQPQSTLSNVMGGVSTGVALLSLLSDERAKTDIASIGMLNDGQRVVRFRYKGDGPMRIGLLAQEVEEFEPDAVSNVGGLKMVDHGRATDRAARMPGYARGGRPKVGQPAIVGEEGPEIFVPDEAGTVVPNDRLPLFMQAGMINDPSVAGNAWAPMMDPSERAATRLRRPYADRVELPQGPPTLATPGEMAQGAAMMVPVAGMLPRMIAAAPRLAAGAGGAGALLYSSDRASGNEPDQIKALQMKLREAGLYSGPIDGAMGRGTQRAKEAFDKAEAERTAREAQAGRDATAAASVKAEQDRVALERETGERAAAQRQQGQERFTEMEANVPIWRQALRDYGPAVGYLTGGALGGLTRTGVVRASDAISSRRAGVADRLIADKVSGYPGRAARVNEVWRQGGAGGAVPFTPTPGTAPGFVANPSAAPIDRLFAPNRTANVATDIAVPAGGVAESVASEHFLAGPAREELRRASEAAGADPSEINLKRLQAAKDNTAVGDFAVNLGRGVGIGYAGSALHSRRAPTQPNLQGAEAERLRIEQYLRGPAASGASPAARVAPTAPAAGTTTSSSAMEASGYKLDASGRWRNSRGHYVSPPPSSPMSLAP